MKKLKIIMLQGLPASGKTTFAKQFVKDKKDWVRVSLDDLRNMRGDFWILEQEKFIKKIEYDIVKKAIHSGFNVIIDATNLKTKTVMRWINLIDVFKKENIELEVEMKKFDITLEESIKRDACRPNPVGKENIIKYYSKYTN